MENEPRLLWAFLDINETPLKYYGFYDNGFYYSRTKLIAKFKVKKWH